jgi:hypothetical protein
LPELLDDMEDVKNTFIPSVEASFSSVNRQAEINQRLLERLESVVATQESQIINLTEAFLKQEATLQEQTLLIQQLLLQVKLPLTNKTMMTEVETVTPFVLVSSKKMKNTTSILPHPLPVTAAPVVKSKTTEVVESKTTERSYSQAVLKNVSQSQEALPKKSTLLDAKDSLAQIVKIQKVHDNSPLVKMVWDFNLTLKAQQIPLLAIQLLIEKKVGLKATDISVINKKVAVLTIKENQKQEFMKLAAHATLISTPKWSKRELQRHTLQYNRAYYSLLRDSALSDLSSIQKNLVFKLAIDLNEESPLPLYLKKQKLKTILYDKAQLLKSMTENLTEKMGMMEVDPVNC